MAYNQDNETREELLSLQKDNRGNYIKVAMIQKNGKDTRTLDIREFWTNDDDEICPTKKGIRIKDEFALDTITAMLKILEYDELEDLKTSIENMLEAADADDTDSGSDE